MSCRIRPPCRRGPGHRCFVFAGGLLLTVLDEGEEGEDEDEDEGEDEDDSLGLPLLLLMMVSGYEWRRMVGTGKGGGSRGLRGLVGVGGSERWILSPDGFVCRRLSTW